LGSSTTSRKLASRSHDKASWGNVVQTERKGRALLKRTDESYYKILLSYEGTFWKNMIRNLLSWITLSVYIMVRLVYIWGMWSTSGN
jgi:hypothetical protein